MDSLAIVAAALAVYHYLITLHEEVRLVWNQRFTGATIIYVANRYVVLSSAVLICAQTYVYADSDEVSSHGADMRLDRC